MKITNLISMFRIVCGLLILAIFSITIYLPEFNPWKIIVTIFLVAIFSDIADGYIARKYNMITNFGKAIDPIADKFVLNAIVLILISKVLTLNVHSSFKITLLIFWIINIFRDIVVGTFWSVLINKKVVLQKANKIGKLSAFVQAISITLLLVFLAWSNSHIKVNLLTSLFVLSTVMSFHSGYIYLKNIMKNI